MNRRFKIKISNNFENEDIISLLLQVPYKTISGKIKYTYSNVFSRCIECLPSNVVTQKQIENYMVEQFEKSRNNTKRDRIIKRMKYYERRKI